MLREEIEEFFKGEVFDDEESISLYSHDASLFEVRPKLIVYPKDSEDLKNLIKFINEKKSEDPSLSLAIRAAGSCMSGGSLNESIIADVTKHINKIGDVENSRISVEPGVFYRDFEKEVSRMGLELPCFPASKNLCALGGMIGNNCGGEKTLRWGKMENFILNTRVIFADGKEYEVRPLTIQELEKKMSQGDFEGKTYKSIFNLIKDNAKVIENARPKVSKNSAGYYIWNVWDGKTFDLNKLLVGSQGTLGVVTQADLRLVPIEPVSKLFVIFLPNISRIAELVNEIIATEPDSIESYDDATLKLAFRFFPEMLRSMKTKHFLKLILSFIPEAFMFLRRGIPKLVVLVEYSGKDDQEIREKVLKLRKRIRHFKFLTRMTRSEEESKKYWTIRRESFNLLRKHVKGRRTAPFVDDVVVLPEYMPDFLPKMKNILDKYKLEYTIAGHAGNGNFHIIPLMDMKRVENRSLIKTVSEEIYELVKEYKGSITGEHNDGLVRTPYLDKMYDQETLELFRKIKDIFDPKEIFNPGKKVPSVKANMGGGSIEYMEDHIAHK